MFESIAVDKDPVCGKEVDIDTAPRSEHWGRVYYFCSQEHKEMFDSNPRRFVKPVGRAGPVIQRGGGEKVKT